MTYDERILIQQICNGDTKKFGSLVDRYGSSLLLFVGRIVEQQEDAEDVLQNTFIAAYEHLKEYNPQRAPIFTWLQRIAYHEALYYLPGRKHLHRPRVVASGQAIHEICQLLHGTQRLDLQTDTDKK